MIEKNPSHSQKISQNDFLVIIGETKDELGGSEYYEYIHNLIGGSCPAVNFELSKATMDAVLNLIDENLVNCVHDCSKGGIAIAVSELCINNQIGCIMSLDEIPGQKLKPDDILFSESHSRYVLAGNQKNIKKITAFLEQKKVPYGIIGKFSGSSIVFKNKAKKIIDLRIDKAQEKWLNSLESLVAHG